MTAPRKRSPDTRSGDRHTTKPLNLRLPRDVRAALDALAKAERRPVNAIVVDLVRARVGLPLDGGATTD